MPAASLRGRSDRGSSAAKPIKRQAKLRTCALSRAADFKGQHCHGYHGASNSMSSTKASARGREGTSRQKALLRLSRGSRRNSAAHRDPRPFSQQTISSCPDGPHGLGKNLKVGVRLREALGSLPRWSTRPHLLEPPSSHPLPPWQNYSTSSGRGRYEDDREMMTTLSTSVPRDIAVFRCPPTTAEMSTVHPGVLRGLHNQLSTARWYLTACAFICRHNDARSGHQHTRTAVPGAGTGASTQRRRPVIRQTIPPRLSRRPQGPTYDCCCQFQISSPSPEGHDLFILYSLSRSIL